MATDPEQLREVTRQTVLAHSVVFGRLGGLVREGDEEELSSPELVELLVGARLVGAAGLSYAESVERPLYAGEPVDEGLLGAARMLRYFAQRLLMTAGTRSYGHAVECLQPDEKRLAILVEDPRTRAVLDLPEPPTRPRVEPQLLRDRLCCQTVTDMLIETMATMERCGREAQATFEIEGDNPLRSILAETVREGLELGTEAMRLADTLDDGLLRGVPSDMAALEALPLLRYLAERLLMTSVASDPREYDLFLRLQPAKALVLGRGPVAQAAMRGA